METFDSYRERFTDLYAAVKIAHETSLQKHRGHGLDHDVAVAQMAAHIAPTSRLADMGWVAAIIHSTDHLVGEEACGKHLREHLSLLPENFFTYDEIEEIYLSALEHSVKSPLHQSPTQEILQDADKLVNMQNTVLMRAGQFFCDIATVELPYLEKINPTSTYRMPKSVLDNIRMIAYEYPELMQSQKGKDLAFTYAERLKKYEQQILEDHQLLGLVGVDL